MPQQNDLRVFISSTFRDLQDEREHLIKKIFPEIRALCRERGVTFTEVDLRWGLTEEEATLGRVIRTCLEEIDKCRPYFIGLIGDRYGWVPELHEVLIDPDLLAKYPWIEEAVIDGSSVTEMEFIHGVFEAPRVDGNSAFFYHRAAGLSQADHPEQLRGLIGRARGTDHPFREFDDVEAFGRMVYDDLMEMIEKHWPQSEVPSELELERRSHRSFAASRKRAYIPSPEYLKRFNEWIDFRLPTLDFRLDEQEPPSIGNPKSKIENRLVITAPTGLGKSALVAYLVDYYRKKNPTALVIEHYVGASSRSGSATSIMRHVVEEIRERFEIEAELPVMPQELERSFPNWLFRAEHGAREAGIEILIVVDAVNQLDDAGRRLAWLPKMIPPSIRLMISTTPGQTESLLLERGWVEHSVSPIDDERVRQSIVLRYLGEFRKGITSEQVRRVSSDAKASSPLYLRVVAEELRLHGDHDTLDEEIIRYSTAADLEVVFQEVLARLERDYTVATVRGVLTSIWGARSGMSEMDLLEVVGLTRLELSRLLPALDYHLLRKDGLLGFFHDYLRRGVEKRYLATEQQQRRVHSELAEYFERAEPTARGAMELIYQYRQSELWPELAAASSRMDRFLLLWRDTMVFEVMGDWRTLGEQGIDIGECYRGALAEWKTEERATRLHGIEQVADLLGRVGRWELAAELYEEMIVLGRGEGDGVRTGTAYRGLGWIRKSQGRYEEAMAAWTTAYELFEASGDRRGMASAVGNMGLVYRARGEYDRALECLVEQEAICREIGHRHGVSVAIGNMGGVYFSRGEHDRALECLVEQEAICREVGDRHGVSAAIGNRGLVCCTLGEYDRALECLVEQEAICRELGDVHGMSAAVSIMSDVYGSRGEYDRALECLIQQETICRDLGDRHGIAQANGDMGNVYHARGEYDRALECYQRALAGHRDMGVREGVTNWLDGKARSLLELAMLPGSIPEHLEIYLPELSGESWQVMALRRAREDVEECVAMSEQLSKPDTLFTGRLLLARVDAVEGETEVGMSRLQSMLHEATDDDQRAELHYWLWRLSPVSSRGEEVRSRTEALRLYQTLVEKTPKHEYRKRIEELADSTVKSCDDC